MMRRNVILAAAAVAFLGQGSPAQAQWYGGYGGWGGWGSGTVYGDTARGMGAYATGLGNLEVSNAQARSINTQNWMNWNEYMYQSEQLRRQKYLQETRARQAKNTQALQDIEQQLLYKPTQEDIFRGDAINALMNQLQNPTVHAAALKYAANDATITGAQAGSIPVQFASRGVLITLGRVDQDQVPEVLKTAPFQDVRTRFKAIRDKIEAIPEGQKIPTELVDGLSSTIAEAQDIARKQIKPGTPEFSQAQQFLRSLAGMATMLREPDFRKMLDEARKRETVTLADVMSFMHVFNAQFGPAQTPEQKLLYSNVIYPKLAALREDVAKDFGGQLPTSFQPKADSKVPSTAIFHDLEFDPKTGRPVAPQAPASPER